MQNKHYKQRLISSKFANQTGIISPQLLVALAAIGLLAFIVLASNLPIKDRILGTFFPKTPSQAQEVSSTTQVSSSSDDVNEKGGKLDTTYGANYPTVYLGGDSSTYTGLRFNNVIVPQGANITSAKLQLFSPSESWIQVDFVMAAENTGNSNTFSNSSVPSSRSLTSQKVTHSSNVKWNANSTITLENIATSVQQVISRPDWKSGNSLSIVIKGNGNVNGRKFVSSFDGNPSNAPKLVINYQQGGVNPPITPIGSLPTLTVIPTVKVSTPTPIGTKPTTPPSPTKALSPTTPPSPTTPTTPSGTVSLEYGTWTPNVTYDTCTKAQHDVYFVIGPDGKKYSTWHPATGPGGCTFGHDHGDNPALSKADNTLPAFGYGSEQAGILEPHVGFKVANISAGDVVESNISSKVANVDARQVIHMGTGGVKRYTQQFHSFEYDAIARDGSGLVIHIAGMADTGPASANGSTCSNPRLGARDFSTLGCNDPYEIWNSAAYAIYGPGEYNDKFHARAFINTSWAVFDPITTRDPADNTRLLYSEDVYKDAKPFPPAGYVPGRNPLSPQAYFKGCDREIYYGAELENQGKPTVVYTDPYGLIKGTQPATGLIRQELSAVSTHPTAIWKKRNNSCGTGVHAPN